MSTRLSPARPSRTPGSYRPAAACPPAPPLVAGRPRPAPVARGGADRRPHGRRRRRAAPLPRQRRHLPRLGPCPGGPCCAWCPRCAYWARAVPAGHVLCLLGPCCAHAVPAIPTSLTTSRCPYCSGLWGPCCATQSTRSSGTAMYYIAWEPSGYLQSGTVIYCLAWGPSGHLQWSQYLQYGIARYCLARGPARPLQWCQYVHAGTTLHGSHQGTCSMVLQDTAWHGGQQGTCNGVSTCNGPVLAEGGGVLPCMGTTGTVMAPTTMVLHRRYCLACWYCLAWAPSGCCTTRY